MIKIVFAMGANNAFGLNNGLPWGHCKSDLQNFVRETKDTTLLMGSNTFQSLPNKLANRLHAVVSSKHRDAIRCKDNQRPDVVYGGSVVNAIAELSRSGDVSVIGGIGVISDAIGIADEIVLTVFNEFYDYDVKVPDELIEKIKEKYKLDTHTCYNEFVVRKYKRK